MNPEIKAKLLRISDLPTISPVASKILVMIDQPNVTAGQLGSIIEQDQALTARLLRIANSPYYGFPRQISTIELAIVLLGFDAVKEIVLTFLLHSLTAKVHSTILDTLQFWQYSVFCAVTARFLSRRFGYRVSSEAFVTALLHDIGVLVLASVAPEEYLKVREKQKNLGLSLVDAESAILGATHATIGGWIARRWNLPDALVHAIEQHHSRPPELDLSSCTSETQLTTMIPNFLTVLTAFTEWIAERMGLKHWAMEAVPSQLYLPKEFLTFLGLEHFPSEEHPLFQSIVEEVQKSIEFFNV